MIRAEHLSFAYNNRVKVLDDISFQIGRGQLVAVLGPNGAGKSTLFRCILRLLNKYEGEIFLDGHNTRHVSRKKMAQLAAYIPQSETPVFNYTVRDCVLMGTTGMLSPLRSPGSEQIEIAQNAIDFLGIGHMAERGINEISGGERQMALLARAIAQKAKVLIMDEPTANLDYGNQHCVLRAIQNMAESGYTILLSTHNPEHALRYATHLLAIKDHRVLADGSASEILTESLIREIYGLGGRILEEEIHGAVIRSCMPTGDKET